MLSKPGVVYLKAWLRAWYMKDTNMKTNLTESRSQWMANALYFPTVEVCLHKAWHQGMCFIVFMFKLFMISEKKITTTTHTNQQNSWCLKKSHKPFTKGVHSLFPTWDVGQGASSHQLWPPRGKRIFEREIHLHCKKKGNSSTWRQVESKGCYISHPF